MWHSFAGVALNVLANFAAVPLFGVEGAAAVTVASLLLITTLNYRSCTRLGFAPSLRELFSRGPLPARPRAADRQTAAIHGNAPGRP
jgi:O-antigen/teichoic acid export membrane protein